MSYVCCDSMLDIPLIRGVTTVYSIYTENQKCITVCTVCTVMKVSKSNTEYICLNHREIKLKMQELK